MLGFLQLFHPPPTAAGGGVQRTFKIFCAANDAFCLTVCDGKVAFAPANSSDEQQHWFKDMRFSTHLQDVEGNPAFSLVNKATGLAISHFGGPFHPVMLVPFDPYYLDDSVMWTSTSDLARSFGCIRTRSDICLNLGADQSATVRLSDSCEGDNQRWKILPWSGEAYPVGTANAGRTFRIQCQASEDLSVTVRDGTVCLAHTNPSDEYQHWMEDPKYGCLIKDEDGGASFALVNKATGDAIKQSEGEGSPVKLVPYNPNYLDKSVLWSKSADMGGGFHFIRMVDDIYRNLGAVPSDRGHGRVDDGTKVVLSYWREGDNHQHWKMLPC